MEDKKNTPYNGVGERNVKPGDRMAKAARALGISVKRISACSTGRQKTAGGYVWESKE